jgi:hypothetical protein
MKKANKILFTLFMLVLFYIFIQFLFNTYEGYSISNKPCKDIPYIKYDNRYICFEPITPTHSTLSIFNHGQQMCEIVPNGKTMVLKDPLNDNMAFKKTTSQLCNPLQVTIK